MKRYMLMGVAQLMGEAPCIVAIPNRPEAVAQFLGGDIKMQSHTDTLALITRREQLREMPRNLFGSRGPCMLLGFSRHGDWVSVPDAEGLLSMLEEDYKKVQCLAVRELRCGVL